MLRSFNSHAVVTWFFEPNFNNYRTQEQFLVYLKWLDDQAADEVKNSPAESASYLK